MRILFITATRIGDAVLSTGLLDHLIRAHPAAKVVVACGPAAEGVFARMPNRAWTIVLEKRRFRLHWLDLWRQVAGQRWDLVVDLRASAFAYTLRAGRRVVARGGRQPGHRLRHLGALLGLDPPPLPVAWFGPADAARAAALLGGEGGAWIGLGPTANWARKVWPAERFVALYRALAGPDGPLPGARAVLLGGAGAEEAAMAAPVREALGARALDLTGRLSLPEAAAVLARCALFVGNDSGLMHLAAAAGAPTLGLFGPTSAEEYAPAGRRAAFVAAPGSPAPDSLPGLTVEAARAAAERLLAQPVPA
ncbi:glycosyltransferase family 9 protein [Crenalkalicoccus roseus]|uniref:glycosyltransferase family 9 protein n=1 Tax=Crenalkalicoccus roseus TaxID=1485588 RepID=UPI001081E9D0|nr:glycosyltransferase family 9 protein [Crenalkalicoccus roseus]